MSKLYVFAIGGTGARVIKAFTMLAATGLKLPQNFTKVIPILIDPDNANGDSNLTSEIISKYQHIRSKIHKPLNFFNIEINTLHQLINPEAPLDESNITMNLGGDAENQRFKDFINYHQLGSTDKSLIDLIYTEKDLDLKLEVGFKGNPNIGSVVLDQFRSSPSFEQFASTFGKGDSVFIISSIFGGTGASGFPLLLKNLRADNIDMTNNQLISKAKIGAITYLPYYKIGMPSQNGQKNIDSSTFFGRAKAALNYYDYSIFRNNTLDAFYYLGEESTKVIPYAEGKIDQRNPAHFLEYSGALSIAHFTKHQDEMNRNNRTSFFEYGIEGNTREIELKHLSTQEQEGIGKRLAAFTLFMNFLNIEDEKISKKSDRWQRKGGYKEKYFKEVFYITHLSPFLDHFNDWMQEMSENDSSFHPFFQERSFKTLMNLIRGHDEFKNNWLRRPASASKIVTGLNKRITTEKKEKDSHFVKMLDEVTEEIIDSILN